MTAPRTTLAWPVAGTLAILIVPTVAELFTGRPEPYMLAVIVLFASFWALTRMRRREIGLTVGTAQGYGVSLAVPFAVMGTAAAAALAGGALDPDPEKMSGAPKLLALMFVSTWIGTILTEDGFFRGWLWGSLRRAGLGRMATLVWTSGAFALWHLPVALLEEDFGLPAAMIPVYITNAFLIGVLWGLIRMATGSVVVVAFCHGVWNALAYTFFGYGMKAGALGVADFHLYGPERGFLGLALNVGAVFAVGAWARRTVQPPSSSP